MRSLKIEIFALGSGEPKKTIRIPAMMLGMAPKMLPVSIQESLRDKGVDVGQIVEMARNPDVEGVLVEIDDHEAGQRIVVSLV